MLVRILIAIIRFSILYWTLITIIRVECFVPAFICDYRRNIKNYFKKY